MFPQLLEFSDQGLFLLRLAVGLIFIYHALPKIKNAKTLAPMMGFPGGMAGVLILGLAEFLSGAGLILGVFTQLAALILAIIMLGALYMKKTKWRVSFTAQDKMGWEFDLILLAANLAILLSGGGSVGI
ncbi:MAG: DoxX family protein [bacterium]|nr:DoxX family protein [bacterium]